MCQLFIPKDFETSLLTLLGVSLVLWRRKADNALSNPCFMALPLTSQHLHFQFLITSLLKFFVRSRRDWKEKMPGRIPTVIMRCLSSTVQNIIIIEQIQFLTLLLILSLSPYLYMYCTVHKYILSFTIY
jgi:hypothetical protein